MIVPRVRRERQVKRFMLTASRKQTDLFEESTMFEQIKAAPRDPILGLSESFREDPNPKKINLSVGVYQDASGKTPVLESVRRAGQLVLERQKSMSYLPIDGSRAYAT